MAETKSGLRVLVCDDDPADRKLVKYCLGKVARDIEVFEAGEPEEIEAALKGDNADLVLMDLQMPNKSGLQWLEEIVGRNLAPVIILTGYGNEDIAVKSLQRGAAGYISKKTLNSQKLVDAISCASVRQKHTSEAPPSLQIPLFSTGLPSGVNIDQIGLETVQALAMMAEMRDLYTAGHQKRVSELAYAIANDLQLSQKEIVATKLAGLIHDIGKIRVPAEILTKPGKLCEAEFTIIKTHPEVGFEIIANIELPWPISRIVREHHERINGSGYPCGLQSKDILIESKILAVADVVEAMVSYRPYRPALGVDQALTEISKNRNELYDPSAVDACIKLFKGRHLPII